MSSWASKQQRRLLGLCYDCNENAEPEKTRCKTHLKNNARSGRKPTDALKEFEHTDIARNGHVYDKGTPVLLDRIQKISDALRSERDKTTHIVNACLASIQSLRFNKIKRPVLPKAKKHDLDMHVLRSDAQVGSRVDPQFTSGLGKYDWKTYVSRLEKLTQKIVTFHDQDHGALGLHRLVSPQLGDQVEGELIFSGQSYVIDLPLVDQVFQSVEMEVNRFWLPLAEIFDTIELFCVIGNHGRCFSENIQLLTCNGWKDYTDIKMREMVPTLNLETNQVENQNVKDVYIFNNEPTMLTGLTKSASGLEVTPDHTMIYYDKRSKTHRTRTAKEMQRVGNEFPIPKCAMSGNEDVVEISDEELELMGLILTDGSIPRNINHNSFVIYQSKINYLQRIHTLLETLGIPYTDDIRNKATDSIQGVKVKSQIQDSHVFRLHSCLEVVKLRKYLPTKKLQKWMFGLSDRQVGILLNGIVMGDGTIRKNSGKTIVINGKKLKGLDSSECVYGTKVFLDDLQALLITHNIPCTLSVPQDGSGYNAETSCVLFLTRRKHFILGRSFIKERAYGKTSWCVTVPNHTLFVRNKLNGKAFVCGNSGRKGDGSERTNWDYVYYRCLKQILETSTAHVKVHVSESPIMLVEHGKYLFCYKHGDDVKSWMGIPYYGLDRSVNKTSRMFNKVIHYNCVGHFHQTGNISDVILVNGTMVGGSDLSINKMASSGIPSQKMFYFDKKYGINRESNIYLADRIDLEADSNGIFTPISRGLEISGTK
jgi:hypothetical protein